MVYFTGHDDGQITEWQGRMMQRKFVAHKGCLTSLCISLDGERLISGAAHFADTLVACWSTSPGADPAKMVPEWVHCRKSFLSSGGPHQARSGPSPRRESSRSHSRTRCYDWMIALFPRGALARGEQPCTRWFRQALMTACERFPRQVCAYMGSEC